MKVSKLIPNPNNPRVIKDHRFEKLCKSIKEFPKMMELRPIIVDESGMVLGGNMRLKAIIHLGMKDVPDSWVKKASDLTDEERNRFIISDNIGYGDWDWDDLANNWNEQNLTDWGFEPWQFGKISLDATPPTVEKNIEEIQAIKNQRKAGNEGVVEKSDTEKYLVIVFDSREAKQYLLSSLGLPEDERYIPAGGVQIIPSTSWISKFKSSVANKSGGTG